MSDINCKACEDLRKNAPEFLTNGVTDSVCSSLRNNTGLSATNGNDDCEDLHDANDCLVGGMEREVKAYQMCDWRTFMKRFISNLHSVIKAIICAICGLECSVSYLYEGASFSFGENTQGKVSYLKPGVGADFSIRNGGQQFSSDITLTYIAGGLMMIGGSVRTFPTSFVDGHGKTKSGNTMWNFEDSGNQAKWNDLLGGELIYEIRIKKSEFPQIDRIFNGHAFQTGGGNTDWLVRIITFDGDRPPTGKTTRYAYGQHGWCDDDGNPSESGYSNGVKVDKGWIFVQARMYMVRRMIMTNHSDGAGNTKRSSDFTPQGYIGVRMNRNAITC